MQFPFFKKHQYKKGQKKKKLLLQTLFFLTFFFLRKIKKVKVGQKLGKKVEPLTFFICKTAQVFTFVVSYIKDE
jgi:hypothetical protein